VLTRVAVVVVTYNSAGQIEGLLDSVPAAAGDHPVDVVVVDNGSTDDTVAVVSGRSDCRVVKETNRGYAAGVNAGVEASGDASAILVLNPDARLHPGAVPALVAAMARTGAGIVAPRVVDADGHLTWSLRRTPTLGRASGLGFTGRAALSEYVTDPAAYATEHPVDWALGAALLVDAGCHRALGGWDESFFLYSEETDFCLRASEAGWQTWFTPDAEVLHVGGGSGQNGRTHAMQIVNRVRFYARRHSAASSALYFALVLASEVTWVLRGHAQSRASIDALLRPRRRPAELGCSDSLIPR
jgi:GT2 family glycosyltransferase